MRFAQILFTGTLEDSRTVHPLEQAVNYAKAAERLGWNEVWTTEHQFNPHVVNPCALTLASYLLGHTERLTIGTGVVVLPHTHPVRLASQASLLQHISGGRLRLGLGRGGQTLELGLFGDPDRWRSGFADDLAEIKHLLATGDVQVDIQTDVPLVPTPTATPLVVAATSESSVQAAAASGVPFIIGFPFPDAFKTQLLDAYRKAAESHGQQGDADHWLSVVVHAGSSREQALKEVREHFIPWNLKAMATSRFLEPPTQSISAQQWEGIVGLQALGTPEDIAERLNELIELTGARNLLIIADATFDTQQTLENLECIMTNVRPLLTGHTVTQAVSA